MCPSILSGEYVSFSWLLPTTLRDSHLTSIHISCTLSQRLLLLPCLYHFFIHFFERPKHRPSNAMSTCSDTCGCIPKLRELQSMYLFYLCVAKFAPSSGHVKRFSNFSHVSVARSPLEHKNPPSSQCPALRNSISSSTKEIIDNFNKCALPSRNL